MKIRLLAHRGIGLMQLLGFALLVSAASGQVVGWRGNWTGLYPDSHAPTEWHRLPKGPMEGMRCSATPRDSGAANDAPAVENGVVSEWLVAGPFPVKDSVADFNSSPINGESTLRPKLGDKANDKPWKKIELTSDRWAIGPTELPWTDVGREVGYAPNEIGYASSSLYCTRAGRLRAVIEHSFGLRIWINGKQVYANPERQIGLGSYAQLSNHARELTKPNSPVFEFDVHAGWNQILCKASSAPREGFNEMRFCVRLSDVPSVAYESKNIAWMAEIPGRGNATPVISGGRIFLTSEPDDLLCFDAATGKRLWIASNNYYDASSQAERDTNPNLATALEPLAAKLKETIEPLQRLEMHRQIQEGLIAIDKGKYKQRLSGHLSGHLGIVGFATPTPCADGKYVYVWFGSGVAACYDLEGHRRWITRVAADTLGYASSPALIDGKLVVYMERLIALDAATGAMLWEQPAVDNNLSGLIPARLADTNVIVSQEGEIVRASDGHVLYENPNKAASATGWSPPTIIGQTIYFAFYGVNQIVMLDCTGVSGDTWRPKVKQIDDIAKIHKDEKGRWIDRDTAGSPLIWNGLAYNTDIWGTFYAVDLVKCQPAYEQIVDLRGVFHYNSIPISASPTLIGGSIYILDNNGTTLVIEPGRAFKQIACNRILTELPRTSAISPQEAISYAPIVADGDRLYLRGERYLYCIAQQ